jgi:uncharacterized coiled-coil DUF342 family protein
MDPHEIEDTSDWLGSPTELETCKHYLAMVENEVQELTLQLRKAREDIFGLVQMNGQLSNEKSKLRSELGNASTQIERLHEKTSELESQVRSLLLIKDQRDYLLRQMGIPCGETPLTTACRPPGGTA